MSESTSDYVPDVTEKGLLRDILAGQGHTLAEAIDQVRDSERLIWLHEDRDKQRLGARLGVARADGKGHWDVCRYAGEFYTVSCDLAYSQGHSEYLPGDGLLEFHIRLGGELSLMTSRTNPLTLSGPSLLVWSLPEGQQTEETIPPQHERSVTIYFEPTHILEHFIVDPEHIPVELARFMLQRDDSVNYCTLPVNPDIMNAANAIQTAGERFHGHLWLNYIHAKSEELICTIVEAFDQLAGAASVAFTAREIELLREARSIASTEIEKPPTIKELAHRIGTNETKLKQGFRAMYGETIFEYRNRKRMNRAMQLVMSGEPLVRVSERVGFKHQTSFTTAFKTFFGLSPKACRKNQPGNK